MHEISITFTNGTKVDEIVPSFRVNGETCCLETHDELANGDGRTILYPLVNIFKISIVFPKEKEKKGEQTAN